jgi:hypothetical protein
MGCSHCEKKPSEDTARRWPVYSLGWTQTPDLPASAFQVLGLQAWPTPLPQQISVFEAIQVVIFVIAALAN